MLTDNKNAKFACEPALVDSYANFPSTLVAALDQAAAGPHGMTFFDGRGAIAQEVTYRELRQRAIETAFALLEMGAKTGDRIAIVAETCADFPHLFFACQYAGLVPVPLPATVSLGGHEKYTAQLGFIIANSGAVAAFATNEFLSLLSEGTRDLKDLLYVGTLADLPPTSESDQVAKLAPVTSEQVSYIQYTSGSTQVARGAVIKQHAIMANLAAITRDGLQLTADDRFFSWLPFYHDMGLVGKLLEPIAAGLPVGFLGTREFAQRPRVWLMLMDKTQATISFGPPFGYELCARRLREGDGAAYDLSNWRVAGVGAEMIRAQSLDRFIHATEGSGFDTNAFVPSYGMAEVGVAASFSRLNTGYRVDRILAANCMDVRRAIPAPAEFTEPTAVREFVICGEPLPGTRAEIRNQDMQVLPERHIGHIWVLTPSAMSGYLNEPEATSAALSDDGWINTGDLGYLIGQEIVITGRAKDILIVNGRNIWPQDLEAIAMARDEVRTGDAMAFSITDELGEECVVMLVMCRLRDEQDRLRLKTQIEAQIRAELSVQCDVHLVDAHALPRTSSGKPSRSQARERFMREQQALMESLSTKKLAQ